MQPLRPLECPISPKSSHSPQSSVLQPISLKRQHIETTDTPPPPILSQPFGQPAILTSAVQNEALSLIKPKDEPFDQEEGTSHSGMVSFLQH